MSSSRRRVKRPRTIADVDRRQSKLTTFIAANNKKTAYAQKWKAYDKSQRNELAIFMKLLAELCSTVEQPTYKFGRPYLPLSDMIFASALKVYSTFSLRRFMSQMDRAVSEGYVQSSCTFMSISNYMRKAELTPILEELIRLSSLPLAKVESSFAVDSSGFSKSRFARYFSYKHGRDLKHKLWIKAHIICGVTTHIVTGVILSQENRNDYSYLIPLVEKTCQAFEVKEVLADKAYSGRTNHEFVAKLGGTAYIPFKVNAVSNSKGSQAWKKMYHLFLYNQEEFMAHYHKRSNCEAVFSMIKAKFKDNIRSKDIVAQKNEILLKVLCHNICVLIQAMNELGISLDLTKKGKDFFV